jgi:hypothetical protein
MSLFEENFLTKQTAEFIPALLSKKVLPPEDQFESGVHHSSPGVLNGCGTFGTATRFCNDI